MAINETANPCFGLDGEPMDMPCCNDISQELKVEEITKASFDFSSEPQLFQIALIQFFLVDDPIFQTKEFALNRDYSPPIPVADAQAYLQVFLI